MPEVRKDPIVDRWVIIAEDRADRPNEFLAQPTKEPPPSELACPFCAGHEAETPTALMERTDVLGAWTVRVVPNKYPAVTLDPTDDHCKDEYNNQNLWLAHPAAGAHEVIIESPRHIVRTSDLGPSQLADVLWAWRDRIAYWRAKGPLVCPVLFKNTGSAAGASLAHVHSQLLVLPRVPEGIARELTAAEDYYENHGTCIFCDLLAQECADGRRMVYNGDPFRVFTAFAGRQPFETWLFPARHAADFDTMRDDALNELANTLHRLIRVIETIQEQPAYNLILHTAPFDLIEKNEYHWHLELIPREAEFAGYELGCDEYIHAIAPERAAVILRSAWE